jgi:hypothetical protein
MRIRRTDTGIDVSYEDWGDGRTHRVAVADWPDGEGVDVVVQRGGLQARLSLSVADCFALAAVLNLSQLPASAPALQVALAPRSGVLPVG